MSKRKTVTPNSIAFIWFAVIALFYLYCPPLSANSAPPIPYFTNYNVEDGLSQMSIFSLTEDNQGFVWIGTQRGVDRFDGINFVNIGIGKEGEGLPGASVFDLITAPSTGLIYAATISGLSTIDPLTMKTNYVVLTDSLGSEHHVIRSLFIDNDETIWVGTENSIFYKSKNAEQFTEINTNGTQLSKVARLVKSTDDSLWIATVNGLWRYHNDALEQILENVITFEILGVNIDSNGFLWLATNGEGIVKVDISDTSKPRVVLHLNSTNSIVNNVVHDVKEMNNGEVWIASAEGLNVLLPSNELVDLTLGLLHRKRSNSIRINRLHQSKSGVIFVGSWTFGIFAFDPLSIKFQRLVMGGNSDTYTVANGNGNDVYFATAEGVWKYNSLSGEEGPYRTAAPSHKNNSGGYIHRLEFDKQRNKLWAASTAGISFIDVKEEVLHATKFDNLHVSALTLNRDGSQLWFSTYTGKTYVVNADTLEVIYQWPTPLVVDFFQYSNDIMWLATTEGLFQVDTSTFETKFYIHDKDNPMSLSHNVITSMYKLGPNNYLVTTQAGGTNRMKISPKTNEVTFEKIFEQTPLGRLSVGGIIEDEKGHLWMSTTQGVLQLDPATDKINEYSAKNGAFNSGYYIASYAFDDSGHFYFTGPEGISKFKPNSIGLSDWQPPIYITSLSAMNQPIEGITLPYSGAEESVVTLSHDTLFVSIDFIALDYANPQSIQYAYRLIGLDEKWQDVHSRSQTITLSHLAPGAYTLEIKATNKDGVWNPNHLPLHIVVKPPWWRTTIAVFGCMLLLATLALSLYRWRIASLQERSRLLSLQVENRTAELEKAIERLTVLSSIDPLTALFNRRSFNDKAEQELSRYTRTNTPFCILLMDIDHFKAINDTYGHDCGDNVLKQLAKLLKRHSRKQDIVARWGGEEFILLLPETSLNKGHHFASVLLEAINALTISGPTETIGVSVTIGLSCIDEGRDSILSCIKLADERLYKGKISGRNKVVFHS